MTHLYILWTRQVLIQNCEKKEGKPCLLMEDRWVLHKVLSDLYGEAGEFGPKSEIKRRYKYMKHIWKISLLWFFELWGHNFLCRQPRVRWRGFQISILLNSPFSKIIYKGGGGKVQNLVHIENGYPLMFMIHTYPFVVTITSPCLALEICSGPGAKL